MADQAARTLRPEDQISHYRIVGPLGAGGMGEVYLAKDQALERSVALKVLPPDLVRSEEKLRRFVLEAKSASSLSHPNIVTIYEIGQDAVRSPGEPDSGPVHFISMELVSGKTLGTLIHEDKTDLRTLLGYLAQAAEGLAKAHAAGIVHRDLKPGNIMVSADGFAKVLDFGLAKLTEKRETSAETSSSPTVNTDATRDGVVMGTAGYMSPEQVQGKAVDHRSDIFSFGCVLYEAAARRRPFSADSAIETMHKILHDKPTPLEELNSQAPAELRRVVRRCLAKSPDQRLQSMKDLAIELREIVDEYDALSASASSGGSGVSAVAPPAAKRRGRLAMGIGSALLVLVALGFVTWRMRRAAPPQSQPFQTMRITTQTSRGDVIDSALSPDGRFLAYLAGRAGRASLRVRQVATGSDVEVLPTADAQISNPSFSPDGNYLFYIAARPDRANYRALFQVPSLGGTPRERAFDVDSRAGLSPDGKQLAFWRGVMDVAEVHLVVLDLDGGKERELAKVAAPETFQGGPAWSPDGKHIAGLVFRPAPDFESTIALFEPQSGLRKDVAKLGRTILNSLAWLKDGSALVSSGTDLKNSISNQVLLHPYPGGGVSRVTNDSNQYGNVSTSVDDTIAAVRNTRVSNLWIADPTGAPARRITSVANPENAPGGFAAASPDTVVYAAPEDRYVQIWSIGTAGGAPRRLTSGEAHSINPRSNGGVVIFDRLDDTGLHMWRMGIDGGGARQLTSGAGEGGFEVSRDGLHVLVVHNDSPKKVSIVSAADGRVVFSVSDSSGIIGFSSDSRSVLIAGSEKDASGLSRQLWRALPVTGGPPTATLILPGQESGPRWAPGGRGITYMNREDPAWNVYVRPFGGGPPVQLTRFKEGRATSYRWSPDGRRVAVRIQTGDTSNLWVAEADGSRPLQVTQFATENIFGFDWLPDGRGIAVNAGTSSTDAVLIRNFR
jgi:Tol biopolymer transport system component